MNAKAYTAKHNDLFTCRDENVHATRRKIVNNVYSMASVLQYEQFVDCCCDTFMESMGQYVDTGENVDLGDWLQW